MLILINRRHDIHQEKSYPKVVYYHCTRNVNVPFARQHQNHNFFRYTKKTTRYARYIVKHPD